MLDAIETLRQRDAEVSRLGIKALGLEWHNKALIEALNEANRVLMQLGHLPVHVPQSSLEDGAS
jgi:hypothetical protein